MDSFLNNTLDNPNEKPPKRWFQLTWVVVASFLMVCLGLVFSIMHWPGAKLLIFLGFAITITRSVVAFLQRKRFLYEWFYMIGNLASIAFLLMRFFNWYTGVVNAILVFVFIAGYCAQFFEWPKGTSNIKEFETEEDDY